MNLVQTTFLRRWNVAQTTFTILELSNTEIIPFHFISRLNNFWSRFNELKKTFERLFIPFELSSIEKIIINSSVRL